MNLRRWGSLCTLLSAAAFSGCSESPAEKAQDERADVVEAEQKVREEQAEANAAEREAREEQPAGEGGPILVLPPAPTGDDGPTSPPLSDEPEDVTAPAQPTENETPPATNPDPLSEDVPNEGAPQAGTSAEGTGERPATAPSLDGEAGSEGQEAGSGTTEPGAPQ